MRAGRAARQARHAGVALVAAASLLVPMRSYGRTESFANFSSTGGLTLSGTAVSTTSADGAVLRLTSANTTESGSMFGTTFINAADFATFFTFRLTNPGGAADPNGHIGADGITFAVQAMSASLGGSAMGLGIGGVTPSVAVEFDTWFNSPSLYPQVSDPSSNHIGIDVNGDVHSVLTMDVTPFMDDGNLWYGWIDYDGTTLRISANETGVRPAMPQLSYVIDIPSILGRNTAYVGFTASTGGSFQDQDIVSWTYFDHFDGGVLDDGATSSSGDDGADAPSADEGGGDDGGSTGIDGGAAIPDASLDASGSGSDASRSRGSDSSGCRCVVGGGSHESRGALLAAVLLGGLYARRSKASARGLRRCRGRA